MPRFNVTTTVVDEYGVDNIVEAIAVDAADLSDVLMNMLRNQNDRLMFINVESVEEDAND